MQNHRLWEPLNEFKNSGEVSCKERADGNFRCQLTQVEIERRWLNPGSVGMGPGRLPIPLKMTADSGERDRLHIANPLECYFYFIRSRSVNFIYCFPHFMFTTQTEHHQVSIDE
ncbi:MAG: hypothetical protein V3U75_08590 [Methylococcaceae bacterium]